MYFFSYLIFIFILTITHFHINFHISHFIFLTIYWYWPFLHSSWPFHIFAFCLFYQTLLYLKWSIPPSTCISTLVLYVPEITQISTSSFISRKRYIQHWYGTVRSKLLLLLVHSTRNYSPHHLNQHHILHSLGHIFHSFDISQYIRCIREAQIIWDPGS